MRVGGGGGEKGGAGGGVCGEVGGGGSGVHRGGVGRCGRGIGGTGGVRGMWEESEGGGGRVRYGVRGGGGEEVVGGGGVGVGRERRFWGSEVGGGIEEGGLRYHDLYLGGKALVDRENVDFELTKFDLCPSFIEDLLPLWFSIARDPKPIFDALIFGFVQLGSPLGWEGSFFFIENKIVSSEYPELLLEYNKLEKKYFKDVAPTHALQPNFHLSLITTARRVSTVRKIKTRERIKMKIVYQDYFQDKFGGNEATNKTQKTLLKQMYENFSAPSTESLDSIFNRLQKIISQLAITGQPNGSQLVYEDLEQIHEDDIEEIDIVNGHVSITMNEDKKGIDFESPIGFKELVSDDKVRKKIVFVLLWMLKAHDREHVLSLRLSRNLMEDMLPLGEEPKEGKLLRSKDNQNVTMESKVKNRVRMSEFCEQKGIKREFSVARTPQQNGVAERRNRTLIEAARTMLADSKLPTTFWAEAVNTACYVQNRVLVVKPHNKTPYELFRGRTPALSFMRPFGCHVTILNTLDYLGKFDGKSDEGFFVGYSMNSKAFRVYNIRTRKVEENLHIRFLEDKPIIAGTNSNDLVDGSLFDSSLKSASNDEPQPFSDAGKKDDEGVSTHADFFGDETKVDMSNITTTYPVPSTPNTRIHKELCNSDSAVQVTIGLDLVDLPLGKRAISTKWVYRNKKDERGFEDPEFPDKVYKVEKALYGLHQAPRAWYETLSTYLLDNGFQRGQIDKTLFIKRVKSDILLVQVYVDDIIFGSTKKELCTEFEKLMHKKFQMSSMGELTFFLGLQVTQKDDGIFISQDKYVDEILKKFSFSTMKTASTPMETSKPLLKDAEAKDVDVHLYRSMIGSLMYLTSSRPDIMFVVCACARFQVTPKVSHLHVVKRIFRYLKGQPKLGLCYRHEKSLTVVFSGRDDFMANVEQTIVANSTTEAEYVAAASCCGQVLWIQNQMLDYGYNFMIIRVLTLILNSAIFIVKNPLFHSKTKHIEIRHHFIRDSNKKKLIQMIKIHTYQNVVDLLQKHLMLADFNI
ncbi:putative ribonuclease H-like domain-containing protein [Tanacetum coccineum]